MIVQNEQELVGIVRKKDVGMLVLVYRLTA